MAKSNATKNPPVKSQQLMGPPKPAQQATPQAQMSAIPYPNKLVRIHCADWEEQKKATGLDIYAPPLTVADAKKLLGWLSEPEHIAMEKNKNKDVNEDSIKFGQVYDLVDLEGNKVRCQNNTKNRPWGEGVSKAYMQDILKRHWEFNGETIIIGQGGRVLSGQHRLIGFVFAEQSRTLNDAAKLHWEEYWKTAVTMECTIFYGIDESSKVTRTLDNVKSRSLSDVIFADTEMFGNVPAGSRKMAARFLDYAVRTLWERTGAKKNSWEPKRTHSEALAFVDQHPRLKECIAHILEEEKDGRISKYIYPGHAAALMYLMAHSGTPSQAIEDYYVVRPSDEKSLNFENMAKAKLFWSDFAKESPEMSQLRLVRCPVRGDTDGYSGFVFGEAATSDHKEVQAVICKAWNLYVKDEPVVNLELAYEEYTPEGQDVSAHRQLEYTTVHDSIDLGNAPQKKEKKKKEAEDDPENPDSTTELTEEEADAKAQEAQGKVSPYRAKWNKEKEEFTDSLVAYLTKSGNYVFCFDDGELVGGIVGRQCVPHPATGVPRCVIGGNEMVEDYAKIAEAGHKVSVIEYDPLDENKRLRSFQYGESTESASNGDDTPSPVATEQPATATTVRRIVRKP